MNPLRPQLHFNTYIAWLQIWLSHGVHHVSLFGIKTNGVLVLWKFTSNCISVKSPVHSIHMINMAEHTVLPADTWRNLHGQKELVVSPVCSPKWCCRILSANSSKRENYSSQQLMAELDCIFWRHVQSQCLNPSWKTLNLNSKVWWIYHSVGKLS